MFRSLVELLHSMWLICISGGDDISEMSTGEVQKLSKPQTQKEKTHRSLCTCALKCK